MKKPPSSRGPRSRGPFFWLPVVFCMLGVACASSVPQSSDEPRPGSGEAVPGGVVSGDPGEVFSAGGEETPLSSPPEEEVPEATETNFITLPPCSGSRWRSDGGVSDGGLPADGGVPAAAIGNETSVDAGAGADADGGADIDGGAARLPCNPLL